MLPRLVATGASLYGGALLELSKFVSPVFESSDRQSLYTTCPVFESRYGPQMARLVNAPSITRASGRNMFFEGQEVRVAWVL